MLQPDFIEDTHAGTTQLKYAAPTRTDPIAPHGCPSTRPEPLQPASHRRNPLEHQRYEVQGKPSARLSLDHATEGPPTRVLAKR